MDSERGIFNNSDSDHSSRKHHKRVEPSESADSLRYEKYSTPKLPKGAISNDSISVKDSSASKEVKLNNNNSEMDSPAKRELLKKLAKLCGVTFFANISTIEYDLEEYVKEILEDATNQSHDIQIREDGKRAGEEITIYDSKNKTMYHTAFSRLTRQEIDAMLKLIAKFDKKGKYSQMRILPHSVKEIQDALERAMNGDIKKSVKSTDSNLGDTTVGITKKAEMVRSDSNYDTKINLSKYENTSYKTAAELPDSALSPYGKWVRDIQLSQGLHKSIKDKYMKNEDDYEEERKQEERKRQQELKKKNKLQREYEEAQRLNELRLKQFMKQQKRIKQKQQDEELDSLKDKLNKAIKNKGKKGKNSSYEGFIISIITLLCCY